MTVGIFTVEIFIPEARSLKDKRQVLRGLVERLRRRHNVSVAEVAHQDLWQRAGLAIVAVAAAQKPIDAMFQGLLDEIEREIPGHIISHEVEFI